MTKAELCEEEDGRLVMHIEGRLDTPDADKVKKDMQELNECHNRDIVLDLTGLKYVCSSGLRLFLNLLKEGRKNGCNVTVTGLSPYIQRVFVETGFARLFKLDESQPTKSDESQPTKSDESQPTKSDESQPT